MGTIYLTKMGTGDPAKGGVKEQFHTGEEIISHAEELLAKELGQDLAFYAGLEEVMVRREVGEDTVYGYVDKSGNQVNFTEDMKLKAAIAVHNVNGHFFEATPVR
jgi:hypothetical protein